MKTLESDMNIDKIMFLQGLNRRPDFFLTDRRQMMGKSSSVCSRMDREMVVRLGNTWRESGARMQEYTPFFGRT